MATISEETKLRLREHYDSAQIVTTKLSLLQSKKQ